jgi:hypothetical protein
MSAKPEPLSSSRHRNLRYDARAGYRFAARESFCPVVLAELADVAREYLIVIPNNETGLPHALLGFEKQVNAYVEPGGRWRASYVPAHFRRYPFVLGERAGRDDDTYTIMLQTGAPHLSTERGEPLFDDAGSPTSTLARMIEFLKALQQEVERARRAVGLLERHELLVLQALDVQRRGRTLHRITGLKALDEARFQALAPGPLHELHQAGALELVHAMRLSRASLRRGLLADPHRPTQEQLEGDLTFH